MILKAVYIHWRSPFFALAAWTAFVTAASAQVLAPIVSESYLTFRVMAANVTSGNYQRYEGPGIRILQGLKPDVVAIQEFNYASSTGNGTDTPAAIREFIDTAFGTNFNYYREPYTANGDIPNGIVSRWPILASGSWDDPVLSNRGLAWARIDLPGTNDLYVVSVHLYSSGSATDRNTEALAIKNNVAANFPSDAWVVVAGDFNTSTRSESAVTTFKTFLSDSPIPTDAISGGDPDTNQNRNKPYDYALPSSTLATKQVPVVIGSAQYVNGLVFDSRVFTPLTDVAPVQFSDCAAFQMQHMAVVKDFQISFALTNYVSVPAPHLELHSSHQFHWTGPSNLSYRVESRTSLNAANWTTEATASSATTNYSYAFTNDLSSSRLYRVVYP